MIEFAAGGIAAVIVAGIGAWASVYQARQARKSASDAAESARKGEFEELLKRYREELEGLRDEVRESLAREHLYYVWIQNLIHHIYTEKPPPPPEPPSGLNVK